MGTDSIDSEMKTKGQTGGQNFADGVKGKEGAAKSAGSAVKNKAKKARQTRTHSKQLVQKTARALTMELWEEKAALIQLGQAWGILLNLVLVRLILVELVLILLLDT